MTFDENKMPYVCRGFLVFLVWFCSGPLFCSVLGVLMCSFVKQSYWPLSSDKWVLPRGLMQAPLRVTNLISKTVRTALTCSSNWTSGCEQAADSVLSLRTGPEARSARQHGQWEAEPEKQASHLVTSVCMHPVDPRSPSQPTQSWSPREPGTGDLRAKPTFHSSTQQWSPTTADRVGPTESGPFSPSFRVEADPFHQPPGPRWSTGVSFPEPCFLFALLDMQCKAPLCFYFSLEMHGQRVRPFKAWVSYQVRAQYVLASSAVMMDVDVPVCAHGSFTSALWAPGTHVWLDLKTSHPGHSCGPQSMPCHQELCPRG